MHKLYYRLRDVRVACGYWARVVTDSVTVRHGTTGLFLDHPYTKGAMDYASGGVGGALADEVRLWCAENGNRTDLRIVLCGHAGEHDALLDSGWGIRTWTARKGYAISAEAVENSASETYGARQDVLAKRADRPAYSRSQRDRQRYQSFRPQAPPGDDRH